MDTSKKYILMCLKAKKELHPFVTDDYCIKHPGFWKFTNYNSLTGETPLWWVPTIDQLVQIITSWNRNYSATFFDNISVNSRWRKLPSKGFDSIEKHLLSFWMSEEHSKIWDNEIKEWIDI